MPRNTSINADIRDGRNDLGARLRELRRAAGLTGQRLADSLSWPASKVSKLENGRQTPSDADVRAWCQATNSEAEAAALLASLHTLNSRYQEWHRQMRGGLSSVQQSFGQREATTKLFRVFESTYIPGLVQTPEYARSRLEQSGRVWGKRSDVDAAIEARMERQRILYETSKSFRLLITEAALLYTLCPPAAMLGQIDRLMSMSMLPNVSFGVIPFEQQYAVAPDHGFWIFDDSLVKVETFSAELNLAQPQEIDLYAKVFESMAVIAAYDRKARTILARASEQIASRIQIEKE